MGLDMYLMAEKYVGGWEFQKPDGSIDETMKDALFDPILNLLGDVPVAKHSRSLSVEITVAYWRKANQIHKWFVDNVQDGVDNCEKHYVSREQLEELRDLVHDLLEKHEKAKTEEEIEASLKECAEKLPPEAGFFFGSTEISDWYFDDLKETRDMLTDVLANDVLGASEGLGSWTFHYQSSW